MKNFDFNNGIFFGCAEMQQVMNQFQNGRHWTLFRRIKRSLNNGISKQVTKLTAQMVLQNEAVKILLPEKWMQD
jgi:hypothetical protein